ncbi:MAG: SUF system Fe-S cluster assembly protein [Pseudomonadota bacterium]|nr:SUF system Fe-S cluster assembly protein [Pseudomonadota bacterium]
MNTDKETLKTKIVDALQTVYDPEIPVSIYELGLIYDIEIKENCDVNITMTLTTPNCPEAQSIPEKVADTVLLVNGVKDVKVQITWEPPWSQEKMTEAAKLELGLI